jgi:hypothetical protein
MQNAQRTVGRKERKVRKIKWATAITISAAVALAPAWAQEQSQQEMRSLDEQVQEIKSDVLTIARDLALLEERLLFPSNTQMSVFVEFDPDESFRLDAVRIELDGNAVAHHIYTFKELEALQGGGVQRIYTGNVTTGSHELSVAVNGKRSNGEDFTSTETFSINKGVEPEIVGLSLAEKSGGASINLGNW